MRVLDPAVPARFGLALLFLLNACAGGAAPTDGPPPAAAPAAVVQPEPAAGEAVGTSAPEDEVEALPLEHEHEQARLDLIAFDDRAAARLAASRPAGTEAGYLVLDLASGVPLAELNADLPLVPASTVKLATALVALDVLGPEHRFRTELLARGPIQGGILQGDLILKGGGDPALDVANLLELAVRLATSGVRAVHGRFLVDDTALPRLSEIEPRQPAEAAYNPGIGALSLAHNRVQVAWRSGRGRVDATTLPPLDRARFEAVPASLLPAGGVELERAGDDAVVWRVADRGHRRQQTSLPVKDPGLHAAHVFRRLARAQGIRLDRPQRDAAPPEARLLAVHQSPPLRHVVRDMLVYSNNMMAETIGLAAATRLGDTSAGLDAAGALLVDHLADLMPEVDWRGATLGNHSGLDSTARLTPRQLAAIARYGWHTDALPALLAAGGWSGTLSNRFDDGSTPLGVWAKTGTLHYGSALAGYLFPTDAPPLIFVVMVSDISARDAYDALGRPGPRAQAAARRWDARARALQDVLVESWLEPLPTS